MKKIVLLTAFAVLGIAGVSCTTDDNELDNKSEGTFKINKEKWLYREAEATPVTDSTSYNGSEPEDDGPGDDPIIILPPKKP